MELDLKDWFSFEGTIEKGEFIKRVLVCIVAGVLFCWIPVLGQAAGLALAIVSVFASIRRHRGLGMNPWMTLILFIPLVGFFYLIYLMVRD